MDVFSLIMGKIGLFLVVFARVSGIFSMAPFLGSKNIPPHIKIGLAFFIALIIFPTVGSNYQATAETVLWFYVGIIIKEFTIGLIIGFISYLVFAAIQMAGSLIDVGIGFSIVSVLDPHSGTQMPLTGLFNYLLAILLFLGVNGHHVLITALSDSFKLIPIGAAIPADSVMTHVTNVFTAAFGFALKVALPVIVTLFLVDVAFGVINRTVPQMNVFMVGMPAKIIMGFLVMVLALPIYLIVIQIGFTGMYIDLYRMLEILHP